jgi:Cu-Zn family superoxide dismutase
MQRCILAILSLAFCAGAQAASEDVQLNLVTSQGVGQTIGSVKISETDRGSSSPPSAGATAGQARFSYSCRRQLPAGDERR